MSLCLLAQVPQTTPATSAALGDPLTLLALGMGVALLVYFLVMRRGAKPAAARHAAPRPRSESGPAEREIRILLDELEQMSAAITARFEAQAQKLERLIREAEKRSAALEGAVARAGVGALAARAMAEAPDGGHDCGLAALVRHREIYDLADAGEAEPAIAQKLGRPAGEVELILALRGGGIS